jgi:hypothetical protein
VLRVYSPNDGEEEFSEVRSRRVKGSKKVKKDAHPSKFIRNSSPSAFLTRALTEKDREKDREES